MVSVKIMVSVMAILILSACSSDDPEENGITPTPPPTPGPTPATLTFSITSDGGQGTADNPFTASPGKPLSATLTQTVAYTDAQGQQHTLNPKATIAISVKTDTLRAADLASLTKLTQPQPTTDTKAGNPKTATRQQLFDIGGQEITFDLSHEIYSYTNDKEQQVELPYVELKAPQYGAATPDKTYSTRSSQGFGSLPVASVTAIRLTPLATVTRGTTVRDTTLYDVAVSFTIDAATHNTNADATQTLSADVHYTALLENTTDVPQAATSMAYEQTAISGTTSTRSPYDITAREPLQIEWTAQATCSYIAASDLATHVITQQPKASITVSLSADTVVWNGPKDGITAFTANEPMVLTSGIQPQQTNGMQTFRIGSQTVSCTWNYEDYGNLTLEGDDIAMPFLQIEAPELLEATMKETGKHDVTTTYEVTARFRQRLHSVHTAEEVEETVDYVAKYTVIEQQAPVSSLTYQLTTVSGTASTKSPYNVTPGQQLQLEWTAEASTTYFSSKDMTTHKLTRQPKVSVSISLTADTLRADSTAVLEAVTEATPVETTSGDNPVKHSTKQSINIGGKTIDIVSAYEAYATESIDGNEVNLPYLKPGKVEVASVSKEELSKEANAEKMVKTYEITVKLRQTLKGEHTPETVAETEEYIVKYIAAVEIKLVSTTYQKDYLWTEPHDNMPWMNYYKVHRTRTYSNGDKEVDTFTTPRGGIMTSLTCAEVYGTDDYIHASEYQDGEYHFVYHNEVSDERNGDFTKIYCSKTGVPDLKQLRLYVYKDVDELLIRGDLSNYKSILGSIPYNPENPRENWYMNDIDRDHIARMDYQNYHVRTHIINSSFPDRFLYLDGQIIDFSEYRMTYDFDFREENITLANGSPAKVITHECKAQYLGKDFYFATIDTVYQLPPDNNSRVSSKPVHKASRGSITSYLKKQTRSYLQEQEHALQQEQEQASKRSFCLAPYRIASSGSWRNQEPCIVMSGKVSDEEYKAFLDDLSRRQFSN